MEKIQNGDPNEIWKLLERIDFRLKYISDELIDWCNGKDARLNFTSPDYQLTEIRKTLLQDEIKRIKDMCAEVEEIVNQVSREKINLLEQKELKEEHLAIDDELNKFKPRIDFIFTKIPVALERAEDAEKILSEQSKKSIG